jgi:YVTN family beta-propeller protein
MGALSQTRKKGRLKMKTFDDPKAQGAHRAIRTATRALFMALLLAATHGTVFAHAMAQGSAYVPNFLDGTVSVIDLRRNVVTDTIDLGNGTGGGPYGVAIRDAGHRVYVTNVFAHTLSVINAATNQVLTNIAVGKEPNGVAVNSRGTRAYVANSESDSVSVVDTASLSVVATISVGDRPVGVAVNPKGARAYVANWNSGTLSVIDTALNVVVATVPVRGNPAGVAVSRNGKTVYVVNNEAVDWTGSLSVIDAATNTELPGSPIALYGSPYIRERVLPGVPEEWLAYYSVPVAAAIRFCDRTMYVSDLLGGVHVVDLTKRMVRGYIPSDGPTFGLSLSKFGDRLLAGQLESDNVLDIRLNIFGPGRSVTAVPVGNMPLGLGNFILY